MNGPAIDLGKWKTRLGRLRYPLLVLLAGILLMALPLSKEGESVAEEPAAGAETVDVEALERRLAGVISQMDGVGEAEVLVTLSAGSRQVLATDQKVDQDSTEVETVLTKEGSSGQSAVTVQVIYPTYQGVLVVCDGGDDPTVRLRVLEAIEALTGLSSEAISICARAGGS